VHPNNNNPCTTQAFPQYSEVWST